MTTGTAASGSPLQSRGQRHKGSPKARIRKGKRDNSFSPTMQRCLFVLHVLSLAAPTYGIPIEEYARFKRRSRTGDCASSSLRAHSIACGWWLDSSLLADWRNAQRRFGLADTAASNLEAVFAAFSWRKGSHRLDDGKLTFVPCEKCGSESFSRALRMRNVSGAARRNCTIGWVREPLGRFESGYREFEWRFKEGLDAHGAEDMEQMTFHKKRVGSEERVLAFIDDLLSLRWYLRTGEYVIPRALHFRNALTHVFPFSGSLVGYRFDVVGDLADYDADARAMEAACGMTLPPPGPRVHPTSNDPQGLNAGLAKALQRPEVREALAAAFRVDFEFYSRAKARPREPLVHRYAQQLVANPN